MNSIQADEWLAMVVRDHGDGYVSDALLQGAQDIRSELGRQWHQVGELRARERYTPTRGTCDWDGKWEHVCELTPCLESENGPCKSWDFVIGFALALRDVVLIIDHWWVVCGVFIAGKQRRYYCRLHPTHAGSEANVSANIEASVARARAPVETSNKGTKKKVAKGGAS